MPARVLEPAGVQGSPGSAVHGTPEIRSADQCHLPTERDGTRIRSRFSAGAIGAEDLHEFPGIELTLSEWRAHLVARAARHDLPPPHLVPDRYRESLLNDAELMAAVHRGLGAYTSRPRLSIDRDGKPRLAWLAAYARFAADLQGELALD